MNSLRHSILVVDDHPEVRTFLRFALEQAGYVVREAENGKDAIELLKTRPSDVVLTDFFMPNGEGAQLLLDVQEECPDTSIIVMTGGSGTRGLTVIAKELGARYVLSKPFSNDELIITLHAALAPKA